MNQQAALFDVDPAARRDHDFYETPSWMSVALLKRIPIRGRVLECCAGHGAITRVLAADDRITVTSNEPYQDCPGARYTCDATKRSTWSAWRPFDWIVSNPPFNLAEAIVPLALEHARIGVAMVLRLSWFEPTLDRADFLKQHPPALINMPRHDFRGDGKTDSVTSAWFIWLADDGARQFGRFPNDVVTPDERDALIAAERIDALERRQSHACNCADVGGAQACDGAGARGVLAVPAVVPAIGGAVQDVPAAPQAGSGETGEARCCCS